MSKSGAAVAIQADPTVAEADDQDRHQDEGKNEGKVEPEIESVSIPKVEGLTWPVSACFTGDRVHPIQRLQARASELSGVTYDEAHEIDDLNLGEQIGEYNMMQLAEAFHKRVLNDKDPWFRDMFSGKEDYPQNLNEYVLQRLGGPSYYSDRKGNPGLIAKHKNFEISPRTAERWLEYMDESLEEVEVKDQLITTVQRGMILAHFKWQAYILVASQEAAEEMSTGGPRPPNTDKPLPDVPYPTYAACPVHFKGSADSTPTEGGKGEKEEENGGEYEEEEEYEDDA